MAAFFTGITGKSITGPHGFEARIFLEAGLSDDGARIGGGGRARESFAAAVAGADPVDEVVVELKRKVFAPDRPWRCF